MKNLFDNFIKNKTVAGLEVVWIGDGKTKKNLCILTRNKSSIFLQHSSINTNPELLNTHLCLDMPIHLVLNGKGIIHKEIIPDGNSHDDHALLQSILPTAKLNDFYLQKINTNGRSLWISVVRKKLVDELLKELNNGKINIISISLGPFCIRSIVPLLEIKNSEFDLTFLNYKIKIIDQDIEKYQIVETTDTTCPLSIGGNSVKQQTVISYSAALSYFLSERNLTDLGINEINIKQEDFKQKRIFKFSRTAFALFFIGIIIVNYLFFYSFAQKKEKLIATSSFYKGQLFNYEKLHAEVVNKEEFLQKTGLQEMSKSSYFADQLASDMPIDLLLTEIEINPILSKINIGHEKNISFLKKTIRIKGTCNKSKGLNEWIKILEKKTWVKNVQFLNYSQKENIGEFSLEIKIK